MNKSETIGELAKALSAVQGQLKPAAKDSDNPFYKSKYADLTSVWDSCRSALSANGLAVVQTNQIAESGVIVETTLIHTSGEWITSELYLPITKNDPQGVSSANTYGRRIGLSSMVGIVGDVDDDGNAASQGQGQSQQAKPHQGQGQFAPKPQQPPAQGQSSGGMSDKQSKAIWAIAKAKGVDENEVIDDAFPGVVKAEMTSQQASDIIEVLNAL